MEPNPCGSLYTCSITLFLSIMYMIAKIISAIAKFLDDVFKTMRCYSRCCEVNECSCSNVEVQDEDNIQVDISESLHQRHQHHSHTPDNNDDELERGIQLQINILLKLNAA